MDASILNRVANELQGCKRVCDLGCMLGEYTAPFRHLEQVVSVDAERRYLESASFRDQRSLRICADIREVLDMIVGDFDAILLIDVIEHLKKEDGLELLRKCKIRSRRIILYTPSGFDEQTPEKSAAAVATVPAYKDITFISEYQRHLSGWDPEEFGAPWKVEVLKHPHRDSIFAVWGAGPIIESEMP